MNSCFDKELVLQLQKDDIGSFDIIYSRYHRTLYLNINKLTKDEEATRDILQEVFISLWENRANIDDSKPVLNWLITVSFNKTVNYLKKNLRETLKLKELEVLSSVEESETPLQEMRLYQLESAVKKLSPQKSRVFQLCKLEGKTYAETAKELKISKYTVKEYLGEAVLNIKEFIRQQPGTSSVFMGVIAFPLFV